jgi:hypothetical protein
LRPSAPAPAPATSGGVPAALPDRVNRDPIAVLVALLEAGLSPEQVWPAASDGFQMLLHAKEIRPAQSSCRPGAHQDAQAIIRQQLAGGPSAPRSAIRVHRDKAAEIEAAQRVFCRPEWVLEPWLARFICATPEEARVIEALLRQDYEPGRGEDQLESAYWVVENLHRPGAVLPRVSPVALFSEVPPDAQLRELFLSPGCLQLTAQELLPVLRAARVGLHVVAC